MRKLGLAHSESGDKRDFLVKTTGCGTGQSEVCITVVKFQASHLTSLNLGFLKINNIYSDKNKN